MLPISPKIEHKCKPKWTTHVPPESQSKGLTDQGGNTNVCTVVGGPAARTNQAAPQASCLQ